MSERTRGHFAAGSWYRAGAFALAAVIFVYCFPFFHVVRNAKPVLPGSSNTKAAADRFLREQLPFAHAADAGLVAMAIRRSLETAKGEYAHVVGIGGTAYFFVHGEGRVVARSHDALQLRLDSPDKSLVELQIGAIFGNVVRDSTGLLDVNSFPSLQEFNALSTELNGRIESEVLPTLRDKALVGAMVSFSGCAEAADASPGSPLLSIVPTFAEVRR